MSFPGKIRIPHGGRRLYGDLAEQGFEIEEQENLTEPISIGDHSETLSLILNLKGTSLLRQGGHSFVYRARMGGLCFAGQTGLRLMARKEARPPTLLVVRWSRACLVDSLKGSLANLPEPLHDWLGSPPRTAIVTKPKKLDAATLTIVRSFHHPPIDGRAADLWFRSQSTELMALWLFGKRPAGRGSRRQEAVQRAVDYLENRLALPWTLPELAREAGCSPFYLSRSFAAEKGMTIKQYLRELRLHRARDLLRSGNHTVTSAGLAVGYRSLSHFSAAFTQRWGVTPETFLRQTAPTAA